MFSNNLFNQEFIFSMNVQSLRAIIVVKLNLLLNRVLQPIEIDLKVQLVSVLAL